LTYTVGALAQSNFGGNLNIYGKPVPGGAPQISKDGSCMIVLATDAPLDARQLKRIAKRGIAGMIHTGTFMTHGSGDFCVAFSNYGGNIIARNHQAPVNFTVLPDGIITPLFEAASEATREAVYNSLTMAESVTGRNGNHLEALDMRALIP